MEVAPSLRDGEAHWEGVSGCSGLAVGRLVVAVDGLCPNHPVMELGETLWGHHPLRRSERDPADIDWLYVSDIVMVVADDEEMSARLGPPDVPFASEHGSGRYDAWLRSCSCGVEFIITHWPGPPGRSAWCVNANDPDVDHVLHHAALPAQVLSRADTGPFTKPLRVEPWLLRRYDDNGQHFDVHVFASRLAAECSLRTFEARGHRQTYVIERVDAATTE